jgi:uncharacterized iron-regulated membrane protein
MRSYIFLAIFSIGAIMMAVDTFRMWRKKEAPTVDGNLAQEYRSLYLRHNIIMVVLLCALAVMHLERIIAAC